MTFRILLREIGRRRLYTRRGALTYERRGIRLAVRLVGFLARDEYDRRRAYAIFGSGRYWWRVLLGWGRCRHGGEEIKGAEAGYKYTGCALCPGL